MVALSGDIKGMFLNFEVAPEHRRFLRFFWWADNDSSKPLVPYQINTHAFGLRSSPAVANFALRSIAHKTSEEKCEDMDKVSATLVNKFYVDDLTSTDTEDEAANLIVKLTDRLASFGIKLHKFASSHHEALSKLPFHHLAQGMKSLPDEGNEHSALGVKWDTTTDTLSLTLKLPQREFTKRGILSVIGSLYDPMGFISPIILGGRLFQREVLPRRNTDRETSKLHLDDPLPPELQSRWQTWCASLQGLEKIVLPRCLHPADITPVSHHLCAFSDASDVAMGYVVYLLTEDSTGKNHLGFICGNSRVAPKNCSSIPRMELNAALFAARAVDAVKRTFTIPITSCIYFTDSRIVLGYLTNTSARFTNYVERRINDIKRLSLSVDWFYVKSKDNPADKASRPTTPHQLSNSNWFSGPQFLINGGLLDSTPHNRLPEVVKQSTILATKTVLDDDVCSRVFTRTNSLVKAGGILRQTVSLFYKLDVIRQKKDVHLAPRNHSPSIFTGIQYLASVTQALYFPEELQNLVKSKSVAGNSPLSRLCPWVDSAGLIRMEGRLENSALPWEVSNPVVLPGKSQLAAAVVWHYHSECHHQGSTITRNAIMRGGYHIVGGSRLLKSLIFNCTTCRRLRGKAQEQKMSLLPIIRVLACKQALLSCWSRFVWTISYQGYRRYQTPQLFIQDVGMYLYLSLQSCCTP